MRTRIAATAAAAILLACLGGPAAATTAHDRPPTLADRLRAVSVPTAEGTYLADPAAFAAAARSDMTLAPQLAAVAGDPPVTQDFGEFDDNTIDPLSEPEAGPDATSGQQYNTHCWDPDGGGPASKRCFRHDHRVEWRGSGSSVEWKGWVGTACYYGGPATGFFPCNWAHTNFCVLWGSGGNLHGCIDLPGRLDVTGWTYWRNNTWRPYNSGGSTIHAQSSGYYDSVASGIRARFNPQGEAHLTNWYGGCSRKVDLGGSGNTWVFDCYGA